MPHGQLASRLSLAVWLLSCYLSDILGVSAGLQLACPVSNTQLSLTFTAQLRLNGFLWSNTGSQICLTEA